MDTQIQERRNYGFALGLFTGAVVGAGLAILFAPRISALQERVTDSVEDLKRRGLDARDTVADAVVRGVHEVERFAAAAKAGRS